MTFLSIGQKARGASRCHRTGTSLNVCFAERAAFTLGKEF